MCTNAGRKCHYTAAHGALGIQRATPLAGVVFFAKPGDLCKEATRVGTTVAALEPTTSGG